MKIDIRIRNRCVFWVYVRLKLIWKRKLERFFRSFDKKYYIIKKSSLNLLRIIKTFRLILIGYLLGENWKNWLIN